MNYSQNSEQEHILNHFLDFKGRLLDIGAASGKDLSNTYQLLLNGWEGVMVEASAYLIPPLLENMKGLNAEVIHAAIAERSGWATFYESNGDMLSTTSEQHTQLWSYVPFKKTTIYQVSFNELFERYGDTFDFINIDIEGLSYEMFKNIFPLFTKCKLWCVEHDSKQEEIKTIAAEKEFNVIYENGENIILTK